MVLCVFSVIYYSENFLLAMDGALLIEELSEDNIPKSLENLLSYLRKKRIILDKNDVMVLIMYLLMLEAGFVPKDQVDSVSERTIGFHYKRLMNFTRDMPKNWKITENLYKMEFVLVPFPLYACTFLCTHNAGEMVVNCYVRNISDTNFSLLIDSSQYIISSSTDIHKHRFQHLKSLSKKFKSELAYKIKIAILHENDVRASIEDFPTEIILEITTYLDIKSLVRFSGSCKRFYSVCFESKVIDKVVNTLMKNAKDRARLQRLLSLRLNVSEKKFL